MNRQGKKSNGPMLAGVLLYAVLLPFSTGGAAAQEGAEEEAAEGGRTGHTLSGSLTTRLDISVSGRDSDFVLDEILRLRTGFPEHEGLSLHSGLWFIQDLDGHEDEASTLRGLKDASGTSLQLRVLNLYLQKEGLWGDSTLRFGRQRILDSPIHNRVDGLYFAHRANRVEWYSFAGARASLYRDSHDEFVGGGGVSGLLTRTTRLSADVYYGEAKRRKSEVVRRNILLDLLGRAFPRRVKEAIDSRVMTLSLRQRLGDRHQLLSRYTFYDGESDEFLIAASGSSKKRHAAYDLRYRKRLEVLGDRANDVTGFYRILGEQDIFDDIQGTVYVPLNGRFTVGFEAQLHEARNARGNTANRDFYRLGTTLDVQEMRPGLAGRVAVERWGVSGGEGAWAFTGEVSQEWEAAALTGGVDYERYKDRIGRYRPGLFALNPLLSEFLPGIFSGISPIVAFLDSGQVTRHENIYSFYVKAAYRLTEEQRASLRASFEVDDGRDSPYWVIETNYTLNFR